FSVLIGQVEVGGGLSRELGGRSAGRKNQGEGEGDEALHGPSLVVGQGDLEHRGIFRVVGEIKAVVERVVPRVVEAAQKAAQAGCRAALEGQAHQARVVGRQLQVAGAVVGGEVVKILEEEGARRLPIAAQAGLEDEGAD